MQTCTLQPKLENYVVPWVNRVWADHSSDFFRRANSLCQIHFVFFAIVSKKIVFFLIWNLYFWNSNTRETRKMIRGHTWTAIHVQSWKLNRFQMPVFSSGNLRFLRLIVHFYFLFWKRKRQKYSRGLLSINLWKARAQTAKKKRKCEINNPCDCASKHPVHVRYQAVS